MQQCVLVLLVVGVLLFLLHFLISAAVVVVVVTIMMPIVMMAETRRCYEYDDAEAVEEEGAREWKVGDVCECLDVVGAPLASLGRTELGGKLVPKKPGMYFKVRLDAVENVWPGFTSDDFPLVICKVIVDSRRVFPIHAGY